MTIPKYIVNASSDDFFLPDNARFYFDALPGTKMLRVAPNASHYGIKAFIESSLIAFTNRLQQKRPLPALTTIEKTESASSKMQLGFSEHPTKLVQWRAFNLNDRDFRLACGIRYEATPIVMTENNTLTVELNSPEGAGRQLHRGHDGRRPGHQYACTGFAAHLSDLDTQTNRACMQKPERSSLRLNPAAPLQHKNPDIGGDSRHQGGDHDNRCCQLVITIGCPP